MAVLLDVVNQDWFQVDAPAAGQPDPEPSSHAPLNRWLAQAESQANAQGQPEASGPGVFLGLSQRHGAAQPEFEHVIVLNTCSLPKGAGQWLTLWPGKARKLKNKPGALGKVSQPNGHAYGGASLGPYDGEGRVFELLRRWYTGQSHSGTWGSIERLSGLPQQAVCDEVGALVLEQAARAGELVILSPDKQIDRHIQWGECRRLRWVWTPAAGVKGHPPLWQLAPDLGEPHAELFMGEPMLYLDRQAGVCGRVDAQDVSVSEARRWLAAPPMSEDWMREHTSRLTKLLPPLPEAVRGKVVRDIRGVAPTPCLRIHGHPQPMQAVFQIELAFDYDGVKGLWRSNDSDLQVMESPEGKVHLWRNPMAEVNAMAQLLSCGYQAHVPTLPALWQAQPGQHPSPHERDLALLDDDFATWREAGWRVEMDEALQQALMREGAVELALQSNGTASGETTEGGNDWFSLSLGFSVGDQRLNLLPSLSQLVSQWADWEATAQQGGTWPRHIWLTDESGQPWRIPTEPLRPWLGALMELMQERGRAQQGETLKLDRFEALRLASVETGPGEPAITLSKKDARSLSDLISVLKPPAATQSAPLVATQTAPPGRGELTH